MRFSRCGSRTLLEENSNPFKKNSFYFHLVVLVSTTLFNHPRCRKKSLEEMRKEKCAREKRGNFDEEKM